ncbi:hypothetical protein ACFXDH_45955 [Streptomyces sp. NPDC059467]|uniref:hypothetical protein n=1 Tax=Streptomyces sp. NPDC059467 TaxID=3346844 RepID=UPI0036A91AE1
MGEQGDARRRVADLETQLFRDEPAVEIRTQLTAAGLPVQAEYLPVEVGTGVRVDVDYGDDPEGGVHVGWSPGPVIRIGFHRGDIDAEQNTRILHHMIAVHEAMRQAIMAILTAGGFTFADSPGRTCSGRCSSSRARADHCWRRWAWTPTAAWTLPPTDRGDNKGPAPRNGETGPSDAAPTPCGDGK